MLDGRPYPAFGDGWHERVCAECGAGWVDHEDDQDWCPWCEKRDQRLRADERTMLLDPPWLRTSDGNPRYDALDDVTKAVWDRTRGQTHGADSLVTWAARLRRAVDTQLITPTEAERALRRIIK